MEQEIFETIKEILKNDGINANLITLDSKFEELGIDSLGGLLLFNELEEKYDINIENDEAFKILSVKEAIRVIIELKGAK